MPAIARALLVSLVLVCSSLVAGAAPSVAAPPGATATTTVPARTVTGTITHPDGSPVSGLTLDLYHLQGTDSRSAVTDSAGRYTVTDLTLGDWVLSLVPESHQEESLPFTIGGASGVTLDHRLVPLLAITGRVTPPAGAPAAGIRVLVQAEFGFQSWAAHTDDQGDYQVGGLRRGRYYVSFHGAAIPTQLRYWPDRSGLFTAEVLTVQDADLTGIDQTLRRAGFITGRVTVPDGRPVPDVAVLGSSAHGGYSTSVMTDEDGRYRLPAHQEDLTVKFGSESAQRYIGLSYEEYPEAVTVASGAERGGVDTTVQILHSLTTGVVTGTGGARLGGIQVESCDQHDRCEDTVTNASGRYWLYNTFGGDTYDLRFLDTDDDDGHRYFPAELPPLSPGERDLIDDAHVTMVEDTSLPPLVPRTRPTISGTAQVGARLTASDGTWEEAPTSYRYQWLDEGSPIAGATARTFVPTSAHLYRDVSVRVTAQRAGYADGESESATVYVEPDPSSLPRNVTRPTITGTPRVGSALTVSSGAWTPSDVRLSYQWFRDGRRVSGQTSTRYVPVPGDLGKEIACEVRASNDLDTARERVDAAGTVGNGLISVRRPTIAGKPKVGKKLTARPGAATPGTARPTYRWKRGSAFVSGATGPAYVLRKADRGKKITLVVTWAQRAYTTVTVSSVATKKVR